MAKKTLKELAAAMKDIDICMFTTTSPRGLILSRPMSNNREVEYDGDSYYYTFEDSEIVKDIKNNPQVGLSFQGKKDMYVSISGKATLVHTRATLAEHWTKGLDMWFKEGIDTPGIVMIHVKGNHVKYWQNEDQGELDM